MRRRYERGFVGGHDVIAMSAFISAIVLGVLVREGSWAPVAAAAAVGLVVYVAMLGAAQGIPTNLGCLPALVVAVAIIGGGLLAHRRLLARAWDPADARWASLGIGIGPVLLVGLVGAAIVIIRARKRD